MSRKIQCSGISRGQLRRVAAALVAAFVFAARGDQSFMDDFNRATLGPNYTKIGTGGNAEIVGDKLRVDMAGVAAWATIGAKTVPSFFRTNITAGSFFKADMLYHSLARHRLDHGAVGTTGVAYKYGKSPAYAVGQNGFFTGVSGGDIVGGSTQILADVERSFATLHIGDPNGDGSNTVHTFLRGQSGDASDTTVWRHNTTFAHSTLLPPTAGAAYMAGQHSAAGAATNYGTFDNLIAYNREMQAGGTAAIKSALRLRYADDFNRANGNLGADWKVTFSGVSIWTCGVVGNQVEVNLVNLNGSSWPTHYASLALTNNTVLGRGLRVGEYVEVDLYRSSNGSTQFGVNTGSGYDLRPTFQQDGSYPLGIYRKPFGSDPGTYGWAAISEQSFDPTGSGAKLTLGCRLDYADGDFMVIGYYINGSYVGSWLGGSSQTEIRVFDLYAQAGVSSRTFYFDNLRIYVAMPPGSKFVIR